MKQSAPAERPERTSDPKKWLLSMGHFKRLEYPSGEQTMVWGRDISEHYKEIGPEVPEDFRWMLEAMIDYVKAPLIVDDFPSETERNAWQKREAYERPEINNLFESNKLKGGLISNVLGVMQLVESEDWLDRGLVKKYAELYEEYAGAEGPPSGYDKMTIEEKIAFTGKIADLAKGLYQAIAERYAPEK